VPGRLHGRGFWRAGAKSTGVHEMLYLVIGWALGVVVCVVAARAVILRYRLPWRATLMYFGLVPYPEEVVLQRHPRPRSLR
jgi:hypothetical protein